MSPGRWLPMFRWAPWGVLYVAAGIVAAAAVGHPDLVARRSGLIPTLRGEAYNPYARRVLAPTLIRAIQATFPPSLRAAIERRVRPLAGRLSRRDNPAAEEAARWRAMEGQWSYAVAGVILNALGYAGFLFALRALLALLFRPPGLVAGAFPLLSLLAIPVFEEHGTFAYDYLQLFLFTLGLYFIAARRERSFLLLLPLATLSKETTLLLPAVYAATRAGAMPARRLARNVGLQLALCAVTLAVTAYACRHHPGEIVEGHLRDNLREMLRVASYFRFGRVDPCPLLPRGLDVPVPLGWNLPGLLALGLVIAPGWREAPEFLKRALPTILLPLVGLVLFYGMWSELRAVREVLPVVLLLLYAGARRLSRSRAASR